MPVGGAEFWGPELVGGELLGGELLGGELLGGELLGGELLGEAAMGGCEAFGPGLAEGIAGFGDALGGAAGAAGALDSGGGTGAVGEGAVGSEVAGSPQFAETPGLSVGGGGDPLGTAPGVGGELPPELDPEFPTETAQTTTQTPFQQAGEQITQGLKNTPPGSSTIAQKAWDQIQKNPLAAGGLALNAGSAIANRNSASSIPKQLQAIAKPTSDVSNDLLAQYKAGTINPGSEFDINKWEQQQIAAAKNYYAKSGQGSSTAANNKVAQIQAQATAMREQARQGLLTQGLNAAGMAQGPLTTAVTAQANQDKEFMSSQSNALQSLMLLQALQSRQAA